MRTEIKILDAVALLRDIPQKQLKRGQPGTIVEELSENVFEVEFADRLGRTIAMIALKSEDLLRLHDEPMITNQ